MGLVLSNAFSMGKVAALQNLGRTTATLRPHSSRTPASYFQGGAATVHLSELLSATAFVSYRPFDATLTADGEARTLITSGYHRTPLEMSKKNNTHAAAAGMRLNGRYKRLHVGLNAVYTHLDRRLQPDTKVLYRRHYPQGTDFVNVSADYSYLSRRFSVNGETAVDGHGALATLNTATLLLTDGLQLMALQRFYSYRYSSLYARSLSEGGRVQNESGVMGGITWQITPRLSLQGYTDYAYMAWPRYQVSQAGSHCSDHFISTTYTAAHWSLLLRYRLHLRQRDNATKTALDDRREQRLRLALSTQPSPAFSTTTQGDLCLMGGQTSSRGYALSQQVSYAHRWLNTNVSFAYFNTDDSATRIYLYERSPLYSFSFPSLSGRGIRYSFLVRANLWQRLTLTAKLAVTNYFDRTVIGTGYQQTQGSSQTALELQCRWRF
jgi:hypothetical protein